MREPLIYINPQKARNLDQDLTLQEIYYRPEGYYRTAEKMLDACKKVLSIYDKKMAKPPSFISDT